MLTETNQQPRPFPLSFALPDGFHDIDLHEAAAERAQKLDEQLQRTIPSLTGEQQAHLLLVNQYMVERMVDEGIIYASNFIGHSDQVPDQLSTAQFTVMVRPNINDTANPLVAVRDALREERAGCATEFVDFSIGRTLVIVEDDHIQMPVTPVGQSIDKVHNVRQIQVAFPLVDRSELAFFALSTECLSDWNDYIDMMAGICKTITWNETAPGEIARALDGLAGPS